MTCDPYTTFKGVNRISDDFLLNILETNFKTYFDWAFLCIGAWFDANIDEYNFYNSSNQHSLLIPVSDESYIDGQVWQGIRKDWIWETGVSFNTTLPIPITGIYVNDVYSENNSTEYSVNYPE